MNGMPMDILVVVRDRGNGAGKQRQQSEVVTRHCMVF